jgi:alternate signal-mediated exported protein
LSRGRRRFIWAAAVVSVLAAGAVTLALWLTQATHAGSVIIGSGQLTAVADTFEWSETTADLGAVTPKSGADVASLADFHAMPGDSLELSQAFAITAKGGNLDFDVAVDWLEDQTAVTDPAPLSATYQVWKDGAVLAGASPLAVGDATTLTGLTQGDHVLTVVVTLTYDPASPQQYQAAPGATATNAGLPPLQVTATQVRGQS